MKRRKVFRSALFSGTVLLAVGSAGCDSESTRVERVPTEELIIQVSRQQVTMDVGDLVPIEATVVDDAGHAHLLELVWETGNPEVATVSPWGMIRALAPGYATIRIRAIRAPIGAKVMDAEVDIRVRNDAASVVLKPAGPFELQIGDSISLQAVVRNAGDEVVDRSVIWFTDHTDVVAVRASGTVVATGPGTALVTAEAGNTVSASAKVSVAPPKAGG